MTEVPEVHQFPLFLLVIATVILVFMSGYFSSSETAMMKLNPYQLKHKAEQGHQGARRSRKLLRRTDRLLGVILIGNNLVNNVAAMIAYVICVRLLGDFGPAVAAFGFTFIMLVFAEVAPKTIAAERPESIAFPSSYILNLLEKILSPVVSLVKVCASVMVNPFVKNIEAKSTNLSLEELRTVVGTEADLPERRQEMLLGILDLGKTKINDIMIHRSEVAGIDIGNRERDLVDDLVHANHTLLPVYENDIDNVIGVMHLKRAGQLLRSETIDIEDFKEQLEQPYFVPSGTPLPTQLTNFQQKKTRFAFVVDEYGTVLGIVTLEDILEEVIGEFTTDTSAGYPDVFPQDDGSYVIDGYALLRDINTRLEWDLPTEGPKTLNGLLLEALEDIPDGNVGLKINGYICETLKVGENALPSIRVVRTETPKDDESSGDPEDQDEFLDD